MKSVNMKAAAKKAVKAVTKKAAAPAAKPAAAPIAAEKPLVDLSKLNVSALRKALQHETAMKPAIAAAYRAELEKREAAAPAAPKAAAKPAAAPKAAAPAKDTLAIHINKTGRVCFAKDAAARLESAFKPTDKQKFCTLAVDDKGNVRMEPSAKQTDGALIIRDASGRPYVSATKQFKPLGFDGSRPYDIEAKPYGAAGFEFRLEA